jgi:hypothetical protein
MPTVSTILDSSVELSLSYGRQSVDKFVLVSGFPLGPMTGFYPYPFFSDNCFVVLPVGCPLWREDWSVTRWLVRSLRTNNRTLPPHLRLCSLLVANYDSQGLRWRYSNLPPHGVDSSVCLRTLFIEFELLYDWRFTANQFVLARSLSWLRPEFLFLHWNVYGHSHCETSSLTEDRCLMNMLSCSQGNISHWYHVTNFLSVQALQR